MYCLIQGAFRTTYPTPPNLNSYCLPVISTVDSQYPPVADQEGSFLIQKFRQILALLHVLRLPKSTDDKIAITDKKIGFFIVLSLRERRPR